MKKIRQCKASTRNGERCKRAALSGAEYCRDHIPIKERNKNIELEKAIKIARPITKITVVEISVSVGTLILSWALLHYCKDITSYLQVSDNTFREFFSTVSQALGGLVGILITLFIFVMGFVEQAKRQAYNLFKSEISKLSYFMANCPPELASIFRGLSDLVGFIESLEIRDFPDKFKEFDEALRKFSQEFRPHWQNETNISNRLYLFQILSTIQNIEESVAGFKSQYVAYKMIRHELSILPKVLLTLILYLTLPVVFGNLELWKVVPNLPSSIMFSSIVWLIALLIELYKQLRYWVDNFVESWKWA